MKNIEIGLPHNYVFKFHPEKSPYYSYAEYLQVKHFFTTDTEIVTLIFDLLGYNDSRFAPEDFHQRPSQGGGGGEFGRVPIGELLPCHVDGAPTSAVELQFTDVFSYHFSIAHYCPKHESLECSLNLPAFLDLRTAFPLVASLSDAQLLLLLAHVTLPYHHPQNPWGCKQLARHVMDLYSDTHRMEGHPDHDGSKMEDEMLKLDRRPDGFCSYRETGEILNLPYWSFGQCFVSAQRDPGAGVGAYVTYR